MKLNRLKIIRIILCAAFFLSLTALFCDFAGIVPKQIHSLAHLQVVPAILSGSIGILLFLFFLALFFGRIYCSIICPLGALQDIFSWITRRGKKKNSARRWFRFAAPQTVLRYSILALCIVTMLFGSLNLILKLDPYSNFGRIAANILRPAVVEINNLTKLSYNVTLHTVEFNSVIFSAIILAIIGVMALLRGRLFCNTVCPVGSLLGLISRYSFFKISIDQSKCSSCGLCEKACKSQCINSKAKTVDMSRCVACFNCLDRCREKSVQYRCTLRKKQSDAVKSESNVSSGRRKFLATGAAIASTLPLLPAWAKKNEVIDPTKLTPITPPGSISLDSFNRHCTACHLCVTHCPQQILKPAGLQYGFDYLFKPHLTFYEMAYCNYGCTVCSNICPCGAIKPLTRDEKIVTQIGIAQFEIDRCVVFTENTSCGACSEHCPTQAVHMVDYHDGLTIPEVLPEICIGCGACESICPVVPIKAINVLANEVHKIAQKPEEEEVKTINSDELDFGF